MDDHVRSPVMVETSRYRIRGFVTHPAGTRLSDYANEGGRDFFAITDAYLAPLETPEREHSVGFILVARHEVGVMFPADVVESERRDDGLYSFIE